MNKNIALEATPIAEITGSGTAGFLTKFTGAQTIGNATPTYGNLGDIPSGNGDGTYQMVSPSGGIAPTVVKAGTTGVLPTTPVYANGASGVGATLTAGSNAAFPTIDGIAPVLNQRYLVKDQASALQNGLYQLSTIGSGSVKWVLTRTTDADTSAELNGLAVAISAGTTQSATLWGQTTISPVVGTDDLTFVSVPGNSNIVTQSVSGSQINGNIPFWTTNPRELNKGGFFFRWAGTQGSTNGSGISRALIITYTQNNPLAQTGYTTSAYFETAKNVAGTYETVIGIYTHAINNGSSGAVTSVIGVLNEAETQNVSPTTALIGTQSKLTTAVGASGVITSGTMFQGVLNNLGSATTHFTNLYGIEIPELTVASGGENIGILYGAKPVGAASYAMFLNSTQSAYFGGTILGVNGLHIGSQSTVFTAGTMADNSFTAFSGSPNTTFLGSAITVPVAIGQRNTIIGNIYNGANYTLGVENIMIGFIGRSQMTDPGSGWTYNILLGGGLATAGGSHNLIVANYNAGSYGTVDLTTGDNSVFINVGRRVISNDGANNIFIATGQGTGAGSDIAIDGADSSAQNCIIFNNSETTVFQPVLPYTLGFADITEVYIGNGVTNVLPTDITIHSTTATAASGTNGANIILAPGLGDGVGINGLTQINSTLFISDGFALSTKDGGVNPFAGKAKLGSGTVVVTTSVVKANSNIFVSYADQAGVATGIFVDPALITPGVNFTISGAGTDNSNVFWLIINQA